MIRLLLFIIFVSLLGVAAAWIAEHPGSVTMYWLDWRIDTSFAFLLLLVGVAALIVAYAYTILRGILRLPGRISQRQNVRLLQHGLSELTYSVAALAAADTQTAERHTKKAAKYLGDIPITLLLSAQIARSKGDEAGARALLDRLLDHKETEYVAARHLSDAASKQQLFPRALSMAQRAHDLNPGDKAAVLTLISLHVRLSQWQEAMHQLDMSARKARMKHAEKQRLKGIILLAQGHAALAAHATTEAVTAAQYILKLLPDFPPALRFAANAYGADGQDKKQKKLLARLSETPASGLQCGECLHTTPEWQPHCPSCGAFDTLA